MKVPIDSDEKKAGPEKGASDAAQKTDTSGMSEQDMIEAAIRAGEQAAADDLKKDADKLAAERDEYAKKLDAAEEGQKKAENAAKEAQDKYLRLQAEWQNFRKRTEQERTNERARANERLVEKLLPVLDDMERAIEHAKNTAGEDANLAQFADGIQAVHTKMLGVLGGEGVEVIDPAGEPFDPLTHQAVGREENADVYEDTVSQVYQKGYRMGGKVIRSAMVTVTYGGKKRPQEKKDGAAQGSK